MNTVKTNLDLNMVMDSLSIERITLDMKMDINKIILFFMQAVFLNKKLHCFHIWTAILSSDIICLTLIALFTIYILEYIY